MGAEQPPGFQHRRMGLLRGRDGVQFDARVGWTMETKPAERGVHPPDVSQFKQLKVMLTHPDMRMVGA